MNRVDFFLFSNPDDTHGIEITFLWGISSNANKPVILTELFYRFAFHIRIRCNQHRLESSLLSPLHQSSGGASTGMNQDPLDVLWPDFIATAKTWGMILN